ncbi:hypothetical protein AtEden1_Chr1g0082711 [Arabidopsis thaliana]
MDLKRLRASSGDEVYLLIRKAFRKVRVALRSNVQILNIYYANSNTLAKNLCTLRHIVESNYANTHVSRNTYTSLCK